MSSPWNSIEVSKPADSLERRATHREVAAVEHDADAKHILDQDVRGETECEVVGPNERSSPPIPIVEAVVARQGQEVRLPLETLTRCAPATRLAPGNPHRVDKQSPRASCRARSRAITKPLRGSSTTRTCGMARATSAVRSRLALLITMISSGRRLCASSECKHAAMNRSSLWAQTMTLMINRS